jgi:hypothetical protein
MQRDQPGQGGQPPEQPEQPPGQPQQPPGQPQGQPPPPPPAPEAQPPAGPVEQQYQERPLLYDDSTKVWLLAIFTCGIYAAIWYYRLCKELGEWSRGAIETDPTTSVLAVTLGGCLIVPPYISWAGTLGRIRQAQQMVGLPRKAEFWPWFAYMLLLGYGYKWVQDQLNEIVERSYAQPAA